MKKIALLLFFASFSFVSASEFMEVVALPEIHLDEDLSIIRAASVKTTDATTNPALVRERVFTATKDSSNASAAVRSTPGTRTLHLAFFNDAAFDIEIDRMQTDPSGRTIYFGRDPALPVRTAICIVEADGTIQSSYTDMASNHVYQLIPQRNGTYLSREFDLYKRGARICKTCAKHTKKSTPSLPPDEQRIPFIDTNIYTDTIIDVLFAFDTTAKDYAERTYGDSGMEIFVAGQIAKMNLALLNSEIEGAAFRSAGIMAMDYTYSTKEDLVDVWLKYNSRAATFAPVAAMQDAVNADIVALIIDGDNEGTVGIANGLTYPDMPFLSDAGLCVSAIQSDEMEHTLTHEIGHVIGAGHAPNQSGPGPLYYTYSSGLHFNAGGTNYHTIMAYDVDDNDVFYIEYPIFSNPDSSFLGVALGTATQNNTLTLRNNFRYVANYRSSTGAFPPPTLFGDVAKGSDVDIPEQYLFSKKFSVKASYPDAYSKKAGKYKPIAVKVQKESGTPKEIIVKKSPLLYHKKNYKNARKTMFTTEIIDNNGSEMYLSKTKVTGIRKFLDGGHYPVAYFTMYRPTLDSFRILENTTYIAVHGKFMSDKPKARLEYTENGKMKQMNLKFMKDPSDAFEYLEHEFNADFNDPENGVFLFKIPAKFSKVEGSQIDIVVDNGGAFDAKTWIPEPPQIPR